MQRRFLERAPTYGKQEIAVLLKRGLRNDARPSGMELFKKVGMLAKMQAGCAYPLCCLQPVPLHIRCPSCILSSQHISYCAVFTPRSLKCMSYGLRGSCAS